MTQSELPFLPIATLSNLIARQQISPVALVAATLERVDRYNSRLHSYVTVCHEQALQTARQVEDDIAAGRFRAPLHGIPVSHKDVSWTKGVRTTAHSRAMLDFVPDQNATHVQRLADTGMILLGKTNTTEFACGTMDLWGTAANPWDLSRYTGGSSCGSANAVAAGLAVAATGSDTGGSIRVPSSFCGVVGMKPTFGRVSRWGIVPLSWSMDQAGPMARTVADCALMLKAMAGVDPLDPATSSLPVPDFTADLQKGIKGLVLGIPQEHFYEGLDAQVDGAMRAALRQLEELGAKLEPVHLPRARDLAPVGWLLTMAEAYSQHAARLRSRSVEYGERARRRIASGAFYTAAEYQQAAQIRQLWIRELGQVMQRVDALVTPTVPFPAFTIEVQEAGPPDTSWNTRHFNLSGHPALSVPCGFTDLGLPVGLQVVARAFDEGMLFRIAHAYEESTGWHKRRPPLEEGEPSVSRPGMVAK